MVIVVIVQTNHSGKATKCAGVATRRGSRCFMCITINRTVFGERALLV